MLFRLTDLFNTCLHRYRTVSVWYRIDMDLHRIYINSFRIDMGSIKELYGLISGEYKTDVVSI